MRGQGRVPERLAQRFPGIYRTLSNKYYVDEVYDAVFVEGLAKGGGRLLWEVDATVVDLIPNGAAAVDARALVGLRPLSTSTSWTVSSTASRTRCRPPSGVFRRAETGRVQNYALFMGAGLFAIVTVYLFFR